MATMKTYALFVALFIVSVVAFFVGAFINNVPLAAVGIGTTVVLYLTRWRFFPKPPED